MIEIQPEPVDFYFIIDRSRSMTTEDESGVVPWNELATVFEELGKDTSSNDKQ